MGGVAIQIFQPFHHIDCSYIVLGCIACMQHGLSYNSTVMGQHLGFDVMWRPPSSPIISRCATGATQRCIAVAQFKHFVCTALFCYWGGGGGARRYSLKVGGASPYRSAMMPWPSRQSLQLYSSTDSWYLQAMLERSSRWDLPNELATIAEQAQGERGTPAALRPRTDTQGAYEYCHMLLIWPIALSILILVAAIFLEGVEAAVLVSALGGMQLRLLATSVRGLPVKGALGRRHRVLERTNEHVADCVCLVACGSV